MLCNSRTSLFDSYISISPAMGWNDQRLATDAEGFFDGNPQLDVDLFMTVGNEGGALLG